MPKTTVRKHPRKTKKSGRTTVKRHKRIIRDQSTNKPYTSSIPTMRQLKLPKLHKEGELENGDYYIITGIQGGVTVQLYDADDSEGYRFYKLDVPNNEDYDYGRNIFLDAKINLEETKLLKQIKEVRVKNPSYEDLYSTSYKDPKQKWIKFDHDTILVEKTWTVEIEDSLFYTKGSNTWDNDRKRYPTKTLKFRTVTGDYDRIISKTEIAKIYGLLYKEYNYSILPEEYK